MMSEETLSLRIKKPRYIYDQENASRTIGQDRSWVFSAIVRELLSPILRAHTTPQEPNIEYQMISDSPTTEISEIQTSLKDLFNTNVWEFVKYKNLTSAVEWLDKNLAQYFTNYNVQLDDDGMLVLRIYDQLPRAGFLQKRQRLFDSMKNAGFRDLYRKIIVSQWG